MAAPSGPASSPAVVRTVGELEVVWLEAGLGCGPIAEFAAEPIGTGQMSESHRLSLTYADAMSNDPETVVIKLAAEDAGSRATGVGLGIYEREVRFYQELAPRIGGPLADCAFAAYDQSDGWFTLLLQDVAPATVGDQIAGCSPEHARLAIEALAQLHGPVLDDTQLAESAWLNRPSPINKALVSQLLPGFLERYGERIDGEQQALCERLVASLDEWLGERNGPQGLVHGDFRLDNLLFGDASAPRELTVVDWQTVGWGNAITDVSYFLGGGLQVEHRRRVERELVGAYRDALEAHGAQAPSWEFCWHEYRRLSFAGVLMAIVASMLVQRTERGDEMFMAMLARHSRHALDLGAQELLAAAPAGPAQALRPLPTDEGHHAPGPELLWNESWYFDAIAPDASFGAYVRVGLYPNLGVCWYTALVCGPGRATIGVVDFAAPLPAAGSLDVRTAALHAEHHSAVPLERFELALDGAGEAYDDPAALLRGERGRPQPVALELTWATAGKAYSYRLATRYEIPCAVSGTIRLGDEVLSLSGAVGQRDHSWGTRDWWAMDWMWSAGHLDDGTHLHAVQLRVPGAPEIGIGYVQSPRTPLVELSGVMAAERLAVDGLIADAQLTLAPLGLDVEVTPLAHAPLRLQAPDGRVSHFPRAMCSIRTADGRGGLAWVEWNLNQRR